MKFKLISLPQVTVSITLFVHFLHVEYHSYDKQPGPAYQTISTILHHIITIIHVCPHDIVYLAGNCACMIDLTVHDWYIISVHQQKNWVILPHMYAHAILLQVSYMLPSWYCSIAGTIIVNIILHTAALGLLVYGGKSIY